MNRSIWIIKINAIATVVLLSGCAAGVKLYDEPKAILTAEIKQKYADADVLGVIKTERQNLANLLAEEIKTVRENNQIQIDFALLQIADNSTPMWGTYDEEARERLRDLGFNEIAGLRKFLQSDFGASIKTREMRDREHRIKKATGQNPAACTDNSVLAADMPGVDQSKLTSLNLKIYRKNYDRYVKLCNELQQEWDLRNKNLDKGNIQRAKDDLGRLEKTLSDLGKEVKTRAMAVNSERKVYKQALDDIKKVRDSGAEVDANLRKHASDALKNFQKAEKALDTVDSGILSEKRIEDIVTLLSAVASGSVATDQADDLDPNINASAQFLAEVPSLAADMNVLIENARLPTASNLLIELNYQMGKLEYARMLQALAKERVQILKIRLNAFDREARYWLAFTDAVCSFAAVSDDETGHPGESCDGITVDVALDTCTVNGGKIDNCVLSKPWNMNIRKQANKTATRELYKSLAAYVQAISMQSTQREQSFKLIDVRHRETLAAKETAMKAWNNLVDTPIAQLDAYF